MLFETQRAATDDCSSVTGSERSCGGEGMLLDGIFEVMEGSH